MTPRPAAGSPSAPVATHAVATPPAAASTDAPAPGGTLLIDAISAAVIGGTSLFGGRGEVRNALIGSLLIATIANGMNILGKATGTIYITTGVILLLAVTFDTIVRQRRIRAGRS